MTRSRPPRSGTTAGPRRRSSGREATPGRSGARALAPVVLLGALVVAGCTGPGPAGSAPVDPTGPAPASSTSAPAGEGTDGGSPGATAPAVGSSDPAPTPADPAPSASGAPADGAAPGGTALDVTVTRASWDAASASVELAGFVRSVAEEGGRCTFELAGTGAQRTVRATGLADATTTVCSASVPGTDLSAGAWSVVLGYTSAAGTGRSAPVALEVP